MGNYRQLHASGKLQERIWKALQLLEKCRVCPVTCKVERKNGQLGYCRIGRYARVASYGRHFGEEAPLVGRHGSGTIFFSGCNLHCVFCQNYDISHIDKKGDASQEAVKPDELAAIMLDLQKQGCHNINFVTPSHVVPQILEALPLAIDGGLHVPLVYNSSGHDSLESLTLLDGVVDIYMPDFKFADSNLAARYLGVKNYGGIARKTIREMHRQVGDLQMDREGIARQGLLVRHLVMPGMLADTKKVLHFLASEISPNTYCNIMDQYRPCYRATEFPEINRMLEADEYRQALKTAEDEGLRRLDKKDFATLFQQLLQKG